LRFRIEYLPFDSDRPYALRSLDDDGKWHTVGRFGSTPEARAHAQALALLAKGPQLVEEFDLSSGEG
jgi:hypothetical protein